MKRTYMVSPMLLLLLLKGVQPASHEMSAEVSVSFGSRGADCRGAGICTISTASGQQIEATNFKATMGQDAQGQYFLEFRYSDLPNDVQDVQVGNEMFEMQSDCPVPKSVLSAISAADTGLTLKTGFYPLHKTSESVRVTFQ